MATTLRVVCIISLLITSASMVFWRWDIATLFLVWAFYCDWKASQQIAPQEGEGDE